VGDEAAALDAMQEAFTQLLLNPQGFEPGRGTLGAYLAGIARHQLLARWRDAKRFVALIDDVDDEAVDDQTRADAAGTELSAEQRLVDAQRSEQLWSAVRRLAWSQREALVLVDLQERSYEEAAAVAGTPRRRAAQPPAPRARPARRAVGRTARRTATMTLTPLSQALREARRQLAGRAPGSEQDAAVLARLTQLQQARALQPVLVPESAGPTLPRRAARGGAWLAGALLLLAGALLAFEPPQLDGMGATPRALADAADSGFLPLVSQEEWRRALADQRQSAVWLMPAELPRERLALLGLPFDTARADERVRAELMLHPSGQLLAVRFVP
jgi:RNA polymerase sigma factor (sigma-70 family)